jgi:DNA-binding MarR family transcriptional regulator
MMHQLFDPARVNWDVMTDVRWLTPSEARAWRALRHFRTPLAAALNRQLLRDSALSSADYEVLVVLSEAPGGAMRAGELGRATGWEKSRLSHHIKRMAARRLIERKDCATDGRGLLVAISDHGRRAIEDAAPGHVQAVRDYVIDLLTPEQLAVLAEVGEVVGQRLDAENCRAALVEECETPSARARQAESPQAVSPQAESRRSESLPAGSLTS